MFNKAIIPIIAFSSVLSLVSCGKREIEFADKTNKTEIVRITIETTEIYVDTAKMEFEKLNSFLVNHEDNWDKPIGTYPTPIYTISFLDKDSALIFPLWIGENWIGTRVGDNSYSKTLNEEDLDLLIEILELE